MILNQGSLPLGFDGIELLIHLFNFIILLVGIRLLLYKPIKKFMAKRQTEYFNAEENKNRAIAQAENKKAEAERIINQARQKAVQIAEEASVSSDIQTREIISNAKENAKEIIEKANEEIKHEQIKAKEQLLYSVSELAVDIASRILEREVKEEDNDTVIKTLIEEWKQDA